MKSFKLAVILVPALYLIACGQRPSQPVSQPSSSQVSSQNSQGKTTNTPVVSPGESNADVAALEAKKAELESQKSSLQGQQESVEGQRSTFAQQPGAAQNFGQNMAAVDGAEFFDQALLDKIIQASIDGDLDALQKAIDDFVADIQKKVDDLQAEIDALVADIEAAQA